MNETAKAMEILGVGFEPPDQVVMAYRDAAGAEQRLAFPAGDAIKLVAGLMSTATVAPQALQDRIREAAGQTELSPAAPIRPQGVSVGVTNGGEIALSFRTTEGNEFTVMIPHAHSGRLRAELQKAEPMAQDEQTKTRH